MFDRSCFITLELFCEKDIQDGFKETIRKKNIFLKAQTLQHQIYSKISYIFDDMLWN